MLSKIPPSPPGKKYTDQLLTIIPENQVKAFKDIPGATFPPDSGSGQPGVFWYPTTEDPVTITRSFARTGHWDGISRWNYETITGSRVINILLRDSVATGVAFVPSSATSATSDNTRIVKARKEVILSAGTIFSPQILQSSGIGPRSVLEAANITVKVELPGVGSNFQDHPLGGNPTFFCEYL
jgi:choline dehydrogenase-like flavoprotein